MTKVLLMFFLFSTTGLVYAQSVNLLKDTSDSVTVALDQFKADSNTDITRGLISLLVRILSGQTPDDIINADLDFIDKIGMGQIIGSQRSNGFASMIKQIKMYALGYKTKVSIN